MWPDSILETSMTFAVYLTTHCRGGFSTTGPVVGYSGFDHVEELSPLPAPNLREVQTTARAFAGICKEGSVVTWGDADCGGDSMQVAHQLSNLAKVM